MHRQVKFKPEYLNELAGQADEVFLSVNGGRFSGSAGDVKAAIMGPVKKSLKADAALDSVSSLVSSFSNPKGFFPNCAVERGVLQGNGGIIGVNTFPVLCQNYHLSMKNGLWFIEEASNTVGGDPAMPLVQAALLGRKTNLITVAADDALGRAYVDGLRDAGVNVHPIWVEGDTPVQFNFAQNGEFMGGIRLRKLPPITADKKGEIKARLAEVLGRVRGQKTVLVGGASNSLDDQNIFGELLAVSDSFNAYCAYDTKDSHLGEPKEGFDVMQLPLIKNFLNADISKPNEGEAYIIEQVLAGRKDLGQVCSEARNTSLQAEYWNNQHRIVRLYRNLRNRLQAGAHDDKKSIGTMICTLGGMGTVVVSENLAIRQHPQPPMTILEEQGLRLRSPQGGGNAFWGGILAGISGGKEAEDAIKEAQVIGLLSTHQLGNGCALPEHIRKALD